MARLQLGDAEALAQAEAAIYAATEAMQLATEKVTEAVRGVVVEPLYFRNQAERITRKLDEAQEPLDEAKTRLAELRQDLGHESDEAGPA